MKKKAFSVLCDKRISCFLFIRELDNNNEPRSCMRGVERQADSRNVYLSSESCYQLFAFHFSCHISTQRIMQINSRHGDIYWDNQTSPMPIIELIPD